MFKTDTIAQPDRPKAQSKAAISRRGLFGLAGAGAAMAAAPLHARSFGTGFTHNVASGEPQASSVLLWTRYVSDNQNITWQISDTAEFTRIFNEGPAYPRASRDYCAKVKVGGLAPDTWYFYRFIAPDGTISPVGRTRTLPLEASPSFKMAVFSCSNYGFGWFNAYAHAAQANDCDLAVHLGDYIYEYGKGTYPSLGQINQDRGTLSPDTEIITLADYRLRYATYRSDPDLQRLHQVLPMIAVWDDHESANDSWSDGAQNHQSETEGEWQVRKDIAKRVYRDWMPVSDEPYAAYDIGDLATLFRLDTRLEGREEQFNLSKLLEGQESPEAMIATLDSFREGAWADPERQLLGETQEEWLAKGLKASRSRGAKWQVLVQQVLIGKLAAPKGVVELLGDNIPDFARIRLTAAAMASEAGLPQNMDAWDGYPAARDRVFEAALEADANLLVFAGDTHNGWGFELAHEGAKVGVELGVCSVSSPGLEGYLSAIPADQMAGALVGQNSELVWADTSQRGYMMVELTPERAVTEYRFMSGVRSRSTQLAGTKRIISEAGSGVLEI